MEESTSKIDLASDFYKTLQSDEEELAAILPLDGSNVSKALFFKPQDRIVVGRDHSADFKVVDHSVSRQHARFAWRNGKMTVEDLE